MSGKSFNLRRVALAAPLGLALVSLSACGNDYAAPPPTPSATVTGTAASFDVWFDEVAFSTTRVGCAN